MGQSTSSLKEHSSPVSHRDIWRNSKPVLAYVMRCVDGDTLEVRFRYFGKIIESRIRILEMDAPETRPKKEVIVTSYETKTVVSKKGKKSEKKVKKTEKVTRSEEVLNKERTAGQTSKEELKKKLEQHHNLVYLKMDSTDNFGRILSHVYWKSCSKLPFKTPFSEKRLVSRYMKENGLAREYDPNANPTFL